jgi:hypothetical protein
MWVKPRLTLTLYFKIWSDPIHSNSNPVMNQHLSICSHGRVGPNPNGKMARATLQLQTLLTSPHTPTAEETERQRDTGIGERKKCVVSLAACPRPASSSLYKAKPTRQPERGVAFTPSSDRQGQRLERERSSSSSWVEQERKSWRCRLAAEWEREEEQWWGAASAAAATAPPKGRSRGGGGRRPSGSASHAPPSSPTPPLPPRLLPRLYVPLLFALSLSLSLFHLAS